jgi:PhoPQ-activated pathogenicity-related protein
LVSQVWQGDAWIHDLRLYLPQRNETPQTVLLFVRGGTPDASDEEFGQRMAQAARAPCAILYGIPNQPLLGGKVEDDLIAETFVRFLKNGDPDWPLLLPMTKSVVKAMDALQAFSSERLPQPIRNFVLTGASKRGWTSWLTAAIDTRVAGVAPRVFDMLNIPAQLAHQLASWGSYSEMLRSYVQPGLPSLLDTPGGRRLVDIVDPYSYRDQLRMPKLMLLGTNDRYWTLDAPDLFWRDLAGPRMVRYIPNAGHALPDAEDWQDTLACFFRAVAANRELPALDWELERQGESLHWTLTASVHPHAANLWVATAATRDFRQAQWESIATRTDAQPLRGELALPNDRFIALFAEAAYRIDGQDCRLSTLVHVEPPLAH